MIAAALKLLDMTINAYGMSGVSLLNWRMG